MHSHKRVFAKSLVRGRSDNHKIHKASYFIKKLIKLRALLQKRTFLRLRPYLL